MVRHHGHNEIQMCPIGPCHLAALRTVTHLISHDQIQLLENNLLPAQLELRRTFRIQQCFVCFLELYSLLCLL